jgi:hypothetical protein
MGEQGFLAMSVPGEYGGLGADFLYSVIVTEEMIRTNHSGLAASLHTDIIVPYIVAFANEEQKHKYLPGCISGDIITAIAMTEPNTGSDLAAIKTTAVESGDEIILNGQKTFISNGINCDLLVLAARNPGEENPHAAVDLYLVEAATPGFEKGKQIKKVGWHSQDTAELYFTDCRIPKANRLGDKGSGFLKLMMKLQQERLVCAIGAVAAAEFMLEITIRYCRPAADQIPEHAVRDRRDGDRGTAGTDLRRQTDRRPHGGEEHRRRRLDGEVLDHGDGLPHGRPLHAALRRLRLLRGVPDRPRLAGHPGDPDLRRDERDHEDNRGTVHGVVGKAAGEIAFTGETDPKKTIRLIWHTREER